MDCWICGKKDATETRGFGTRDILHSLVPFEGQRHYCPECFKKEKAKNKERLHTYLILKKELMFERAMKIIERADIDMYSLKEELDIIDEFFHNNPDRFDSAHEMVVAVFLLKDRIHMKTQQKILGYRADFFLPDDKIVLEVDGELHQNNLYRDNARDIKMRQELGADWEVVRISTKYIEQNPRRIVEAMYEIKEYKQNLRKKYNGFLPDWYSNREFAKRPKKKTVGDENMV